MSISTETTLKKQIVKFPVRALISDDHIENCLKIQLRLIIELITLTKKFSKNSVKALSYNMVIAYKI